jgi:outer membrane protein TolC
LVSVAIACVCSVAQAEVVKLAELEARALSERPEVAASAARIRQASAEVSAAESTYWPSVSANLDGSLAPGRALLPYKAGGKDYLIVGSQTLSEATALRPQPRYGASVAAHGTLYDFGRTHSALEAARAKTHASEADATARAQVLVLEVRAAYLRWSVAQALWELAKQAEVEAKTRAERIGGLIAEGAAPPSAATAASAQAIGAESESERAALELETARLELGFVSARDLGPDAVPDPMLLSANPQPSAASAAGPAQRPNGRPPPAAAGVVPAAPNAGTPSSTPAQPANGAAEPARGALPPSAARLDSSANPQLAALEKARAAAEAARRMQSRLSAPVLAYRLNAGVEAADISFFPAFGVGVGLTVPLWDGGATSAAEAAARAAEAELSAQLEAERARDKHAKARRDLQSTHADKLLALAENALAAAETRVQQLREGPTLAAADQEALATAETERTKAGADVVRARAARVQLQLGL